MLRDRAGNRLFRKVIVKIIFPENIFPPRVITQHAGPHQGFNDGGIDDILMGTATQLENLYPYWEFRVVDLKPEGRTAKYIFTFAGYRNIPTHTPIEDSNALGLEAEEELTPTEVITGVGNSLVLPLPQEKAS